jgi:hypothetical protein
VLIAGAAVVTADGTPTASMPSDALALPLPVEAAQATGRPPGTEHVGAW